MEVPEWLCTLVGRLVLENEVLKRAVADLTPEPPKEDDDGGHT